MRRIVLALFLLGALLAVSLLPLCSSAQANLPAAEPAVSQAGQEQTTPSNAMTAPEASSALPPKIAAYTLPPDRDLKARRLARIAFWGRLVVFVYSVLILLLILKWRLAPKFRDWAERSIPSRALQVFIFAPLFFIALAVLDIPTDLAQELVLRKFGFSVQSWGSWSWDWTKGLLVSVVIGIIVISVLYAVIRSSPRRWWFYFWMASIPIVIFLIFLQPLLIDPLFHKFEPLAQKDPALTVALEKMVHRAGKDIPPDRMFWMGAGAKTTTLNAYVTGFGASKRIVVWDTTIAKMTTPEIVFVTGHEMGHYVLQHIPKELTLVFLVLLIVFYIGYRWIEALLARKGEAWGIRGLGDWASLPALLLVLTILIFIASPVINTISRHFEHQADQYGLEVTHGLTPDSGQVAANSFQILGDVDLADPDPSRLDILLFYDHPAIPDRVRFSLTYDPWANGGRGEFVK
ncbi:MAG: M48 family metallopeptidase [Candidatus Acidiferrales bacterium]